VQMRQRTAGPRPSRCRPKQVVGQGESRGICCHDALNGRRNRGVKWTLVLRHRAGSGPRVPGLEISGALTTRACDVIHCEQRGTLLNSPINQKGEVGDGG
jgi:hypothetical protein